MGGRRKPKGDMTRLLGLEDGRGHGRSMRKPPVAVVDPGFQSIRKQGSES